MLPLGFGVGYESHPFFMDYLYKPFDLICLICLNSISDSNPGEKICSNCHAEFEIDDRGECMFVNPGKLRLPVNGTVCSVCGLVQGEGRDRCGFCGAALSTFFHRLLQG